MSALYLLVLLNYPISITNFSFLSFVFVVPGIELTPSLSALPLSDPLSEMHSAHWDFSYLPVTFVFL